EPLRANLWPARSEMELIWPRLFACLPFLAADQPCEALIKNANHGWHGASRIWPDPCSSAPIRGQSVLPLCRAKFLDHHSFARIGGDDFTHHLLRRLQSEHAGKRDHAQHMPDVLGNFDDQIAFAHSHLPPIRRDEHLINGVSFPIPANGINPLVISLLFRTPE